MKKPFLAVALLVAADAVAQIPTGSISGQLLNRDGQPAAAVRVSAMAVPEPGATVDSATALVSIAMTDAEGRYRLENVLPGRYSILAGFVDLPTYYPGAGAPTGATAVNVLSGTPVTGINFSVANTVGVSVSGRVRRAMGTGSVGGQRVAMIGGTSGIQEVTTTADGSFQFPRVRPGTYQLGSSSGVRGHQPLSVTIGDMDVTGLEILVVPTVDVTGNVTIEGNGPRPTFRLQFSPFKGNGQSLTTASGPDGAFRATVSEGDYRVSWTNLPAGYEIKSLAAGNVDLLTTPLKASVDAPPPAIRVLLSVEGNPFVKVSGRVTNVGSNRTLTLSGPNADQLQLTINPDGTFEIPQALPGIYQIRPNIAAATPSLAMQPHQVVIPNQDTTNLVITLPLTRDVPGIVVNAAGVGVQGRFSLNYTQRSGTATGSGMRSMTTQPDGRFSIEIPVGADLQLNVTVPGYTLKSITYGTADLTRQSVSVTAADTAEIRVVLDTTSTSMPGGVVGGFAGGGTVTSSLTAPPPQSAASGLSSTAINRISEALAKPNLVSSPPPVFPPLALSARVQGTVVLQVEISTEGRVQNVSVVSGHALLNEAAIQAVRQWTYKPFVLNGQAIPVVTTATVPFTLP